jgi:Fe-S oxidoreductase
MLIMNLRDHAFAKAPYLMAGSEEARAELDAHTLAEAERPLVGVSEGEYAWHPEGGAIIDNDVLWSCTNCGACVNQCPVDIEHVDHIIDMRRYQVLVENNFPAELNQLFKGLEGRQPVEPVGVRTDGLAKGPTSRCRRRGPEPMDSVDWLFDGCAGAYEDRARRRCEPSPSCSTRRRLVRGARQRRPVPATPHAVRATSSSTRAWPRTSRR